MIAPRELPSSPRPQQPRHRHVVARYAAQRRVRRNRVRGYAIVARIVAALAVLLVPVLIYVMLMANLTGLNYTLAHETQARLDLLEETQRLDDQIAHLGSRERLAALAAKMHLHDPHVYAVVPVPKPAATAPPNGIAFLGALFHR